LRRADERKPKDGKIAHFLTLSGTFPEGDFPRSFMREDGIVEKRLRPN